ncbi:hypothetical protein MEZE111188_06680 [Mesobacillus zeae]
MWLDMYEKFADLSDQDKLRLFNAIKEDIFPEPKMDISKLICAQSVAR